MQLSHVNSIRLSRRRSIGVVNGGFAENVIPEKVEMKGTLRFTSLEVQKQIREEVKRAFEITKALGGT